MNTSTLERDNRLPLYQRIRDDMLERIANRQWLPDHAIPTEAELTQLYGVAIGTIRKAVDTLVNDGLLLRVQGRGTFIQRPNFGSSLFRFFRQRGASGSYEVPQSQIMARNVEPASSKVSTALQLPQGQQVIHLERQRLLSGRLAFIEDIWLDASRFAELMDIELSAFGNLLYPFYEERCQQLVASARETLTIASANDDIAKRLDIAKGAPIAIIERLAMDYGRQPLEYRLSRSAADNFCYQIEIS